RLRDIVRIQTTGDDNRAESVGAKGEVPVECRSRAGNGTIEKKRPAAVAAQAINAEVGINAETFNDFHALDHGAVIRRLVAMKLHGVQTNRRREIFQTLRIWMIYKNSYGRHERRQLLDDFCSMRRINVSRTLGIKNQTDSVGAEQCSVARVFEFGNAADF